jgi:NADP-dependent 3-hydroxy acid dehydrogenase YdfG
MAKLIMICGSTGGVGGSVARKDLAELGAQLTVANYDDVTTLEQAFKVRIVP